MVVRHGATALVASALALSLPGCGWNDPADGGCEDGATGPGGVVGFDVDSGAERWSLPVGTPDGAALFDDTAVVSSNEHVVRGIALESGEVIWCVELDPDEFGFRGGIAPAGPTVGAFAGDSVIGLDPATGEERWRQRVDAPMARLSGGELLAVFDGSASGTPIMVLDPMSGEDVEATGELSLRLGIPPVISGDFVLTSTPSTPTGRDQNLSVSDGEAVVWQLSVDALVAGIVGGPDGPVVIAMNQEGSFSLNGSLVTRLSAYAVTEPTADTAIWELDLPGTPFLFAQISADLIVVPVGTTLHAIDVASGVVAWVQELPSAGQRGSYDLPGTFRFINGGSSDTAVAVGSAEQPYRD